MMLGWCENPNFRAVAYMKTDFVGLVAIKNPDFSLGQPGKTRLSCSQGLATILGKVLTLLGNPIFLAAALRKPTMGVWWVRQIRFLGAG